MKRVILSAAAAMGIAGCVAPPPSAETPLPPATDQCGAPELQYLVGRPASVLDTMRFSQPVRFLRPGMVVTMDFNPSRLNIETDAYDRIRRVYCG